MIGNDGPVTILLESKTVQKSKCKMTDQKGGILCVALL
jgi:hypothetical protein